MMKMRYFVNLTLVLVASAMAMPCAGQTTREEMAADLNKTGGVYYAYPTDKADNTKAPKGYVPFHISHYGRHGSRYLISDNDYDRVVKLMHLARQKNALTPLGQDVAVRIDSLMTEAQGRGGDLSPLGRRQHKRIASNMISNYPEVFANDSHITARSTLVPRCIISMASFCEALKEKNSRLTIDMESSNRYMPYLCWSSTESNRFNESNHWSGKLTEKMKNKLTNSDRITASIFSDKDFVKKYVQPDDFMWSMYWLASDSQNTEGRINFYDIFEPEELFNLWQSFNQSFYIHHCDYPAAQGIHFANAKPLLRNIIETADKAIESRNPSAALRFGHDGNIIPLLGLMGVEGTVGRTGDEYDVYKVWCDWKVSPMAANMQMIFYRNARKPGEVIVKILHNEKETHIPVKTDMWPYYRWQDVRDYFMHRIDSVGSEYKEIL